MIRQARLFIAAYISVDILLGMLAFTLAYLARFETGFFPAPKGQPPFEQYLTLMPFIGLLVPISFHLQGVYRLRRNRTRVDDFFAILVGTLLTVMIGLLGTLTTQAYFASSAARAVGAYEVSRLVWALFVIFNVSLSYAVRDLARTVMRRRFKAGLGLRRVLIAGTGELGRHVADRFLRHSEFGYKIIGFIDETNDDSQFGYRGIPLLGSLLDAERLIKDEGIDQLYVALPLDQHVNMLKLIEISNRECVDIKVIPDFLQFVTLRARLEELDGIPLINVNDVPIRGFNSAIKRVIDIGCSSAALAILSGPMTIIAAAIRLSSDGPILYRQERMGLDGQPFELLKFRSMYQNAESESGPVWASENDPRRTTIGKFLRRFSLDELPQLWNVLMGDMSLVGPRPERPFFVDQFKDRVPQYMLRHKVKAGITGWAQVNGWRGNTSIEKRIEYDLYYIENWSVALDFKIMWLTILHLSFHRHAY
jgi:Undecaprenyl-phosphate glucose phosphotransferase|tara:strand:- start:333 stop:1769 length:1437 start_codon:yes stop_codon:yes gene_type:complete